MADALIDAAEALDGLGYDLQSMNLRADGQLEFHVLAPKPVVGIARIAIGKAIRRLGYKETSIHAAPGDVRFTIRADPLAA